MSLRGLHSWAVMLILFAAMVAANVYLETRPREPFSGKARAVDGDSLELGNRRVRLIGIDAPEYGQTCEKAGGTTPCGRLAHAELKFLISGKRIVCESVGYDNYDRTLAKCHAGETDLGAAMVRAGWAISYGDYRSEERQARRARAGIWAGEFIEPADWRVLHGRAAADISFWQRWF
jgi:endonuclease YncB( thermonuclease family)